MIHENNTQLRDSLWIAEQQKCAYNTHLLEIFRKIRENLNQKEHNNHTQKRPTQES